jgi:hypothetical protein
MSQARSRTQVRGLEQALRELKKIEPEYVKDVRKKAKTIAAPAVADAKAEFVWQASRSAVYTPDKPGGKRANKPALFPLSGLRRGELIAGRGGKTKWNPTAIKRGIRFRLGGPKKSMRKHRTYRMFSIIQADAAGAIFDMAGKKRGTYNPDKVLEESLEQTDRQHKTGGGKGPSRYMWPAVESSIPDMERQILVIVDEIAAKVNRRIRVTPRKSG